MGRSSLVHLAKGQWFTLDRHGMSEIFFGMALNNNKKIIINCIIIRCALIIDYIIII